MNFLAFVVACVLTYLVLTSVVFWAVVGVALCVALTTLFPGARTLAVFGIGVLLLYLSYL